MSESWIQLLERVGRLRDLMPTLMADHLHADIEAQLAAFAVYADPIAADCRSMSDDQQESIEFLLDEILISHGLMNPAERQT